ncbi:MAG: hypothetical protein JNN28_01425 [Saprospiraceae bacterium]|nr:hypothetical protein [Saprospiraceae bacterium]
MKKKFLFSLCLGTIATALSIFWVSCHKSNEPIEVIESQTAIYSTDRGGGECGRCDGDLGVSVSYPLPQQPDQLLEWVFASPQIFDWHIKVEERICPDDQTGWLTTLEFDDDDPKAIGPNNIWTSVTNLLAHDKYYRVTFKNESLQTPLYFNSRIRNGYSETIGVLPSAPGAPGWHILAGYKVNPNETITLIYIGQGIGQAPPIQPDTGWRSDCGCPWNYNCGGVNGN